MEVLTIKRATIKDISQEIGVSVTTVYKALNNKPKVSESMRKRILAKAEELNYRPNPLAQGLARNVKTVGILIPHDPVNFVRYVESGAEKTIQELNYHNIHGIIRKPKDPEETHEMAMELIRKKVDGFIILPNESVPGVKRALEETGAEDMPVITIVSETEDGTPALGMARSNGYILGRMAAQYLNMCVDKSKQVAIFLPNENAVIHKECYESFLNESILQGRSSAVLYKTKLTGDAINYEITQEVITNNKNLGGIYVASNNALGVCKYLEDNDRMDVKVVGHDLYPELAECIRHGSLIATLFQNQALQSSVAVKNMVKYLTSGKRPVEIEYLRPELVMLSNLECYEGLY